MITSNTIDEFLRGRVDIDDGPAGGEIYIFTASRHLGHLALDIAGRTFHPRVELPLRLEIVDENARDPFPSFHGSIVLRWIDFPWNERVKTSIATGVGLSYWSKMYRMDIQRHPDGDRSRLKFDWPIQLSLASPSRPNDQLILFILHQSGAGVFDSGGVNSIGIGYRREF